MAHRSLTLARTHHSPTIYSHCLHSLYLPLLPHLFFFFFPKFCVTVGVPTCKTKPICQQSSHERMIDCLIYIFQHAVVPPSQSVCLPLISNLSYNINLQVQFAFVAMYMNVITPGIIYFLSQDSSYLMS